MVYFKSTAQVLKFTCDDADCRKATGGYDYYLTEIRDGLFSSDADYCPECGSGKVRIVGELNEYAKAHHAAMGIPGVLD